MAGIVICCFIMEIWKYQLGLRLFFQEKLKRKWLILVGAVLYIAWFLFGGMKEEDVYLIMNGMVMALLFFTVDTGWRKKVEELVMLFFIITCLDSFFGQGVYALLEWCQGAVFARTWDYFGSSVVTACALLAITAINDRKHILEKEKLIQFIRKGMIFLVIFMVIEIILTVTGLSFAKEHIANAKFKAFAGIVSAASYFAVSVLGIFLIYIKNANEKMEQAVETERALKEMQEKYYEALLKKEEETRKYRHDLNNHLVCLHGLAQEEHARKVADYIEGMQKQTAFIQKKSFITGNKVLDSLINHYDSIIGQDTKLTVSGRVEDELQISDADLCTIFGNLLQNAAEGVMQVRDGEKFIQVEFEQGREYLRIRIENSTVFPGNDISQTKKFFLETEKGDKRNHGIGLGNVQETAKRYHGKVHVAREGRKVVAEVILKNRITV